MAALTLEELLRFCRANDISDVHLKPNRPPIFRKGSNLVVGAQIQKELSSMDIVTLLEPALNDRARNQFRENGEADLGWGMEGLGRFRINLFRTRVGTCAALRVIPEAAHNFKDLGLPKVLEKISMEKNGLVLVTGATGQGKSTTLAAIIDYINRNRAVHIITIEDPVEYYIQDKKSLVTQRQVGLDTPGFLEGLRAALRQDPDVIMVGEMRDLETIETALHAAETGHLVFSTMHTIDTKETVNRILAAFPTDRQDQARYVVSSVLKAVVSQRLVNKKGGRGRVPAVEVMVVTPRIRDLLRDPKGTDLIPQAIEEGKSLYGMQTFDQSLFDLVKKGVIDYSEAKFHATNPSDFELKFKGIV